MTLYSLPGRIPEIHPSAFIAPGVAIIGHVTIGEKSSVWFHSVLRGDTEPITIGRETNIQDLTMCHADPGKPLILGNKVTVGHRCILHGCYIEDECLIGMGAIIMNEAKIGRGSIVGAGAIVLEGTHIPPFSLVVGAPAAVKKTYDAAILATIHRSAQVYVERAELYRTGLHTISSQP